MGAHGDFLVDSKKVKKVQKEQ